MKQLKRSYTRSARLLFAALLLLMVAGSVYDFQISSFLYPGKESSFGQFFAAFGELPAFLALICAGVLLFRHRGCLRKDWNILYLLASAGLILGGIFLAVHEATDNVPAMPSWVPLLVTVFFAAICSAALLLVTNGAPGKTVIRFVLTLIFVCVGTMLLINIIKVPWGRARMRLIASTGNASYFTPWWKAVVAFSRLRMGAHFLTDVTMAWLVTLGLTVLGVYLFYFNKKFFQFVWNLISEREEQSYEQE